MFQAPICIVRSGTNWSQQAYLKSPNAEAGDRFGYSVSVSGATIIVGAYYESSNQTPITNGTSASADDSTFRSGAAYVFTRSGTTWSHQAYLKAPNAKVRDYFGQPVSVSGDTIVVGAYSEDSNQTSITNGATASSNTDASDSGAAYVFIRSGDTWSQQAYLKAPNAGQWDSFGESVSISGDTIIVGASSEDSNQTTITNGTTANTDNSISGSGAAYIFVRSGSTWVQQAYLKAPNAETDDRFGDFVAVSEDTIVVGAWQESSSQTTITNGTAVSTDNGTSKSGAAYVFVRSGTNWSQQAYLKAPNVGAGDEFGQSVAISGNTIVVGAHLEDSNQVFITNGTTASSDNSASDSGAAYVFVRE